VATTRHCSRFLLSLVVVSVFVSLVMNYIVVKLVFACRKLYSEFDDMCVILILCHIVVMCEMLYNLPILEAPHSGRQAK
jgi:hypothetical protein